MFLIIEYDLQEPQLYPNKQIVSVGSTILLQCIGMNKVWWTFRYEYSTDYLYNNNVIILNNVQSNQTGYYYCGGRVASNMEQRTHKAVVIVVGVLTIYFLRKH